MSCTRRQIRFDSFPKFLSQRKRKPVMRIANQETGKLTSTGASLPDLHEQYDDCQQVGQVTCESKDVHDDGGIRC